MPPSARVLLTIGYTALLCHAQSTQGIISGRITDSVTGKALANAAVSCRNLREPFEDDPDLLDARHNLALALSAKHASPEAEMLWRTVLTADPAHLPARLALAEYLLRERRFEEAVEQYRLLLETRPDFTGARADFAEALVSSGRKADALAQLQLVDKASPNDPSILEKMGDLQVSLNQTSEAKALYEAAAAFAQDSKTRRRIRRKLAQIAA